MNLDQYQSAALRTASIKTASLSTSEFDLVHATMGLCTEAAEVVHAVHLSNIPRIIDEIGDFLWYQALLARALGCDMAEFFPSDTDPTMSTDNLVIGAAAALDLVKKNLAYGKPYTREKFFDALRPANANAGGLCQAFSVEIGDVLEHNIEKLRRRYPEAYSDKDAIAQADYR
jgi:NTP pyrophosphatase (non-canonical NTP hydrolase)